MRITDERVDQLSGRATMNRISTPTLVLLGLIFIPSLAAAQATETVRYYHTDAIGSVRAVTDENGQTIARYDFLPFGEEFPPTAGNHVPLQFTGKERDYATGLDYIGARYYASGTGTFASADPITADALRIVNPQRWNRYAYAVNNPLKYVDPDGLDALLVNYTDGAFGFGHVGIVALNPDGSWLYGGFNPVNAGQPIDRGMVKAIQSLPRGSIEFGDGGRPTIASLRKLRQHLASVDGKSPEAIRIRHIKTSEAETAALAAYIQQNIGSPADYSALTNNCLHFCVRGMDAAGIPSPPPSTIFGGVIPDLYFRSIVMDLAARLAEKGLTPKVETSYCIKGTDCR